MFGGTADIAELRRIAEAAQLLQAIVFIVELLILVFRHSYYCIYKRLVLKLFIFSHSRIPLSLSNVRILAILPLFSKKIVAMTSATSPFHYDEAFSRNGGWIAGYEQQLLRGKRVAVAGLGGVGGAHVLTLARLGIGALHLADMDVFEIGNFNRQAGAFTSTLGKSKVDVIAGMARDINPELDIRTFPEGISAATAEEFFQDVDVFIDGLDAYLLETRQEIFRYCHQHHIPAITAAPLGMGVAYLIFMPDGMSFDDYFAFDLCDNADLKQLHFFLGLSPKPFHRHYIADPSRLNVQSKKGFTTSAACQLASGVAVVQACKILLGRGKIEAAPYYHQYDPYMEKFVHGYLRKGLRNPWLQCKLRLIYKPFLQALGNRTLPMEPPAPQDPVLRILDLARWSPSADNTQPWRFTVMGEEQVEIRILLEGKRNADPILSLDDCQLSFHMAGMLLETLRIAASDEGRQMTWEYQGEREEHIILHVTFTENAAIQPDELAPYIKLRHTDRLPYRTRALTAAQKQALDTSVGDTLRITWLEGRQRKKMARLAVRAFNLRMRNRHCCETIARSMEFKQRFSRDKLPVATLTRNPLSRAFMSFAMRSGKRLFALCRLPGATWLPALEFEYIPNICCAAHAVVSRPTQSTGQNKPFLLKEGMAIQRFWLTASRLGLSMQPNYGLWGFAFLGRNWLQAKGSPANAMRRNASLAKSFDAVSEEKDGFSRSIALFRVGIPATLAPASRSIRHKLEFFLK